MLIMILTLLISTVYAVAFGNLGEEFGNKYKPGKVARFIVAFVIWIIMWVVTHMMVDLIFNEKIGRLAAVPAIMAAISFYWDSQSLEEKIAKYSKNES